MRVDEAMAEVDKFLDGAFGREEERVLIIHGLGTSALRNAIRKYLDDCKYCRRFRPGEREEGGEGVTVVEMS
jgi:DNA mismatch repair protein MutS2